MVEDSKVKLSSLRKIKLKEEKLCLLEILVNRKKSQHQQMLSQGEILGGVMDRTVRRER